MHYLYITADQVGLVSGGGIVTKKESEILQPHVKILDKAALVPDGNYSDPFRADNIAEGLVAELLKTEVINLAHFYSGTFSKTVQVLRRAGVKVSYTVAAHDKELSIEEFGLLGLTYPFEHIKNPSIFANYSAGYKDADLLICPSKLSANAMSRYGLGKALIIPHGIEDFIPPPMPKKFKVGYFGALGPDKGVVYLLRAWKALGYTDSILLIGGRDSEEAVGMIRAHGGGSVQITGFVKSVTEFYSQCSVYVQPSICEGYGIEILEAMGHGRLVIASEGAGAIDAIDNGVDGFIVPIRSPSALAEKIEWCKAHPREVTEMGARALAKSKIYSWSLIQNRYRAAWNNLLQKAVF
jgi:glycosyltransferase involved in cell wall biosynthesis